MGSQLLLTAGAAALLALGACHGAVGGGGGSTQQNHVSLNNSNAVSAQEQRTGALNLQAVSSSQGAGTGSRVTVLSRHGRPMMLLNINDSKISDLMQIPGMSLSLAMAIVNNRPYRDRADLISRVPGLSPALARSFDPYLTYNPAMGGGGGMARPRGQQP